MCNDRRKSGFTLVELLVVLAVIGLLLALLLPALASVKSEMRTLKCSSNLRSICFKFQLFASGQSENGRGDSEVLGPNRFFISDFVESIYRIDEFWDAPDSSFDRLQASNDIALCPAGAKSVQRRRGMPCSSAAVGPTENVSLAFNMRLYRAEVEFNGQPVLAPSAATRVRIDVLDHQHVPLVMDGDGKLAEERSVEPFFIAPPPTSGVGPYAPGRWWMPATRHRQKTQVGFVGGHVLSSATPERERWDWSYQAEVSR